MPARGGAQLAEYQRRQTGCGGVYRNHSLLGNSRLRENVLAYDAYYRYFMGKPDKILADGEWNRRY